MKLAMMFHPPTVQKLEPEHVKKAYRLEVNIVIKLDYKQLRLDICFCFN